MESNIYNGVRAEPKFLKDPTSFESISSGISRISSYVTSNLPKRKSTSMTSPFDPQYQQYQAQQQQQQQQQQAQQLQQPAMIDDIVDDMEDVDTITFASFEKLEYRDKTISCLLLGYHDGFQLWDITNPDNVHELVSIRDKDAFGVVSFIHILQGQQEPTLAIISETTTSTNSNLPNMSSNEHVKTHNRMSSNSSTSTTSTMASSHLIIYSLQSQSIIKEINDFGDEENDDTVVVTCIKSNHKVIVLGCLSRHRSSIRMLSTVDYTPFATPLTDIYHDPNQGPIFTLGSRFIAYATNTAVLNSDPVMTSLTNKSISYSMLQGDKDVKGAAKDIAKEVVSGMKTLGEFGMNTLQNYFGNQPQPQPQGPPQQEIYDASSPSNRRTSIQNNSPKDNAYINASNSSNSSKKMIPSGMIMIRDILKLPKTPTRNLSLSILAHFRPHTHPVSCLAFNQAGTLLMSSSKQGHTFHIFSILTNTVHGNASHLYSLARGITDAQVVDCQFSVDSTWCAITTARGTTHVYAINPYGGKPEIFGHVHGKVNNPVYHPLMANNTKAKPKATSLSSVVRIKQRRKMPGNSLNSSQDDLGKFMGQQPPGGNGYTHGYYGPTPPQYIPSMMVPPPPPPIINRNITKDPRAKIIAMFVTASKSPYLVNNSVYKNSLASHNSLSSPSDPSNTNPLGSIKQQATNMLSTFGSSMSHLPYMPTGNSQQPKKWDKNAVSDTLMFGFDEEYDDSAKMINDEVGYQDMYSFHPDGVLTLHRCWVAKTVVRKRENGRTLEKLDLSLKEEDVAEWRVARNADWDQVRLTLDPVSSPQIEESNNESQPNSNKKKKNKSNNSNQKPTFAVDTRSKKLWLSNAEITTYTNDEPALWSHHQFSFQTYQDSDDLQRILHAGIIPKTDTLIILKGMPEPVSSRIDRVRKTTTRIANDSVEENIDDAVAELQDNLSTAMQSNISPSPHSMGNSPATNRKWLSSNGNGGMNASPSPSMTNKSFLDRNSSLSFEDAYLINMGSGPSPEPSMHGHTPLQQQQQQQQQQQALQHSSLIQFDDDDDDSINGVKEGIDVIRVEGDDDEEEGTNQMGGSHSQINQQSEVYSPDGDNEVEYPNESVIYETSHHHRSKLDSDDDDDDQVPW